MLICHMVGPSGVNLYEHLAMGMAFSQGECGDNKMALAVQYCINL